jgi:exopolysaccharide production protein ExoZ
MDLDRGLPRNRSFLCTTSGIEWKSEMLPKTRSPETLLSIQALRAVAALSVLAHHITENISNRLGITLTSIDARIGAAGVDLFFIISGFIIVYASEPLFGKPAGPQVFFLRRLIRIAPLYWTVTAFFIVLFLASPNGFAATIAASNTSIGAIIASFMFLPFARPDGTMFPLHSVGWTLNYEVFFYVIFAGAVILPRERAVAAVGILFVLIVAAGHLFAPLPQPFAYWSDPIILEFCFGMMLALAYLNGVRLPPVASYGLVVGAVVALAATAFRGIDLPWRTIEWGLPATALLGGFVLSREAGRPGILGRSFLFLGSASYSLYLLHPIVFIVAGRILFNRIGPAGGPWVWAALLFALSLTASALCYLFFEKPATRALHRRLGKRYSLKPAHAPYLVAKMKNKFLGNGRDVPVVRYYGS